MIKYPLYFDVSAESPSGTKGLFQASAENFSPIVCAIPPGFHGSGGGYSPEDLYALAAVTCFIATFKVFAEKAQLKYTSIKGDAKLTVDRDAEGNVVLQKIDMTFALNGVQDQDQAKKVLTESEKFCLVSNAITSQKSFSYIFSRV